MIVTAGKTNVSVSFYVVQDASGTSPGEPVTGLLFSDIETGGSASYARLGAARVDLTLITLASASAVHADGGFILVDDTNMPGHYRCDFPDAAFVTGVDQVTCQIVVASAKNAVASPVEVDITDVDLRNATSGGITNLDAAITTRLAPTTAGRTLDITAGGTAGIDWANLESPTTANDLSGTIGLAVKATGLDLVLENSTYTLAVADAIWDEVLTGATHNVVNSSGRRVRSLAGFVLHEGTMQAGSTASTAVFDTGASSIDDFYNHARILTTGGTGVEQERIITDYVGATRTATITPDWVTTPDATTDFDITPGSGHAQTNEGGYENGQVYISASGSTTAQVGVDGTIAKPIDDGSFANAIIIADEKELIQFHLLPGSSVTLAATINNREFLGIGYTIALGGQDINNMHFQHGSVSGIGTAADEMSFDDFDIGTVSFQNAICKNSSFSGTVTQTLAGDYSYINCNSGVAGGPTFTKTVGQVITVNLTRWSGDITISGVESGDTFTISGILGTITLNGAVGTVNIQGTYESITDNRTGSPVLNIAGAVKASDVASILVDTGTTLPAAVLAAGDIDGYTLEESQKVILAAVAGKLSGAATATNIIRAADDSKDRITATVDAVGNRSAVTIDETG